MKITLFLPILLIAFASCKSSKKITEIPKEEIALKYSRSACFGTCPVYEVVLTRKGEVYFIGRQFVPMLDTTNFTLDSKTFRDIKAIQNLESYLGLTPNRPEVEVVDVPVLNFSDPGNGLQLDIKMDMPGEIDAITSRIDRELTARSFLPGKGENALEMQEIILELPTDSDPYSFNRTFRFYELNYLSKISDRIFLFRLTTTKKLIEKAIADLNSSDTIIAAQKNHELEHR